MIPIECLLAVSAVMLFAGIYGFLTRKSTLAILLNAADLNFAVFNRLLFPGGHEGLFFSIFAIAIAAAESAIAIAIMINIYRHLNNLSVDQLKKMKW